MAWHNSFQPLRKITPLTVVLAVFLNGPLAAQEDPHCRSMNGCGITYQSCPDCPFEGTATLTIAGEDFTVDVSTVITDGPTPNPDGTLQARTAHTITLAKGGSLVGQFTTIDDVVLTPLVPPCQFTFDSAIAIDSGIGDFDFCYGTANIDAGQIDLCAGEATWCIEGDLCLACPADISPAPAGNGVVNVDDLLAVINAWGDTKGVADITSNGNVNVDDLLAVINAWGPCP